MSDDEWYFSWVIKDIVETGGRSASFPSSGPQLPRLMFGNESHMTATATFVLDLVFSLFLNHPSNDGLSRDNDH